MELHMNIFLIGPRACGKTRIGRLLANSLGAEFVDTDHFFVDMVGMEIAPYVERYGWEGFREMETEALASVSTGERRVIGCGGGIVLRESNRAILASGVAVYLKTAPEVLVHRLQRDPHEAQRPSLTGHSVVDEVASVLSERAALYEGCADIIAPEGEPDDIVKFIKREILLLS